MTVSGWQVTQTSIYCDAVEDEITMMVHKDWSAKCVGYKKYAASLTEENPEMLKTRGKKLGRELRCEGPECYRVIGYRDKLFAEEEAKAREKHQQDMVAMMQERRTEEVQEATAASGELVRQYHHSQWDVEHVLVALLQQEQGPVGDCTLSEQIGQVGNFLK